LTIANKAVSDSQTDKVSVLGSTIEYVHHLKDRLKTLQKEHHHFAGSSGGSTTAESDAQCCTTGTGSKDEAVNKSDDESPKIEVDLRGKTILLRVLCREKKGVLIMVLTELENHGLSIINTNVVPFAESSLNITITAQVKHTSLALDKKSGSRHNYTLVFSKRSVVVYLQLHILTKPESNYEIRCLILSTNPSNRLNVTMDFQQNKGKQRGKKRKSMQNK